MYVADVPMVHRACLLMFAVAFALASSSAHAATVFTATLLGSNETPPNASTATGTALLTLSGDTLSVTETFSGLVGGAASAAHIHCCDPPGIAAIVAVPFTASSGFPIGATSGTYANTFDLTLAATYNPVFITNNGGTVSSAEAVLIAGLDSGLAYVNIHDAEFPSGEIRGQLRDPAPRHPPTLRHRPRRLRSARLAQEAEGASGCLAGSKLGLAWAHHVESGGKINFVTDEYTSLTAREREIVLLVLNGLTNKAIANELHLSEGTVKIHLHNVFIKIGVKRRRALSH